MANDSKINERGNLDRKEPSYPLLSLGSCLKLAEQIYELGGSKGAVSKGILSQALKLAEDAPVLSQRLGSAKMFGMINGRGEYQLTEIANSYFLPTEECDKVIALVKFLGSPPAFRKIISRFDGSKLPTREMLGNIMHKETGVPVSWKDRAAGIFLTSAEYAGVLDSNQILRCASTIDAAINRTLLRTADQLLPAPPLTPPVVVSTGSQASQSEVKPQMDVRAKSNAKIWNFVDGEKSLHVETPHDMPAELWELLNNYVQYLKPKERNG